MCRKQAEIIWARHGVSIFVKLCESFAYLPTGLSNHYKVVLWPGCEGGARCNLHKKNERLVRFTAKWRGRCCNLSVDVTLKMRFTANWMCAKSNKQIYVTWTSNNRIILSDDLYYCLLPQCEALRTYRSSFLITTQEIYFLVFRMPNAWNWPEMNMFVDLNLETFHNIDGFGCYHFCLNRFGLELIIVFWTLSQLSVQFWDYRLLQDRRLTVDCSHQHVRSHLSQAQCSVALSQPKKQSNRRSSS